MCPPYSYLFDSYPSQSIKYNKHRDTDITKNSCPHICYTEKGKYEYKCFNGQCKCNIEFYPCHYPAGTSYPFGKCFK